MCKSKRRISLLCVTFIFLGVTAAQGASIIVGSQALLPNTPGQTIAISVVGVSPADDVQGLNFNIQVADGGPEGGGSVDGPAITAVDIVGPGTIFNANNTGQVGGPLVPQIAGATTTTNSGTVTANGILGFITFDTTGFNVGEGPWPLLMSNTLNGPTDFAGVQIDITDGQLLLVVPEPLSGMLAAVGIALMLVRGRCRHR